MKGKQDILLNVFNKQIVESLDILEKKDKNESSCLLLLQTNMNSIQGIY